MANNQETNLNIKKSADSDLAAESGAPQGRREVVQKLGKFAAYAAPFTVLAFSAKGATASGPPKHK